MRLKSLFRKINKDSYGQQFLLASEENCRDLEWFLDRYPMEIQQFVGVENDEPVFEPKGEEVLRARARAYDSRSLASFDILNGKYELPDVEMALPAREYQEVAAAMLLNNRVLLLADELGLGKTVSAIRALADKRTLPALVVCQTHLPSHWRDQLRKFLPKLRCHIVTKSTAYDITKKVGYWPDVVIMTYSKIRGWAEYMTGKFQSVVFDEIQELRRKGSQKYEASEHIADSVEYTMGLSATPIYNYGNEFWCVYNVLKHGVLGSWMEFLREWCSMDLREEKSKIKNPKAFGTYLREQGLMLLRTREEVGRELPALNNVMHEVECNVEELKKVEDKASELARIILTQKDGFKVMRASQEFSNTLRQATGIAKAPYVAAFVRMLIQQYDRPVLLFGWHREVYRLWAENLGDLRPAWYTGSESPSRKEKEKKRFLSGDTQLMIMSLRSGSGLDGLQDVSSSAVIGELDWSPGVMTQCVGRLHRDGQKYPVFAYYPIAVQGADPFMVDIIGLKMSQLEGVRDPEGKLVAANQVDPNHIKKLARAYLSSRAKTLH